MVKIRVLKRRTIANYNRPRQRVGFLFNMKATNIFTWILLGILFVILIFFSKLVALVVDWWWFSEIGFTQVFIKSLGSKIFIFLAVFIFSLLFLLINFLISTASKIPWMIALPESLVGQPISLNNKIVSRIAVGVSLLVAFFVGLIGATFWQDILKFFSATPFGWSDPIFGKDIAFYIFTLPVLELGLGLFRTIAVIALFGCGLVYIFRGSLSISSLLGKLDYAKLGLPELKLPTQKETSKAARLHLGILLSLFLATLATGIYLSIFKMLTSQGGSVSGAAYTDVNVMIPFLRISILLTIICAILSLLWSISGKIKPLLVSISLYAFVGLISAVVPSIFQKLVVTPNELVKETPFIKYNITATQKAFGLDGIEEREILAEKQITAKDITNNNLTIKNVRLWDRAPLLSTFSQIQEIRTYYEFNSVDNDRYTIDKEIRQIMLSPRELASESLPSKTWINERLTFTHGYGVAGGPVNQVTSEGLPVLFVKDLPPKSEAKELNVTRPEIYYGELPNDYVVLKTKAKEFDYPKGDENVYRTYEGRGGVEISSPFRRIIYALRFGSPELLLSNDITADSRIMYYRKITERVAKVFPFLILDRDPYMVVADGKLYWIIDAYTSSNRYPYSQLMPLNGDSINYIRNSVKVVVDAYDGAITFYQADNNDPIVNTYAKIFPKAFQPLSEIPKALALHLRYPEDIFTIQTSIYSLYHMDEPQIFYNREDQWEIPSIGEASETAGGRKTAILTPRHMIMKLPGEKKEEYILMLPFTPRAKDNLSAWMVARNDGESYGKLMVYRFPKQKLVFGPKQIIGRINQDAEISKQISLWDQGGSQVIQGPLLVIPIEESLIYVRPLYLKAEAGKIPELKRVIVAYENKIAMEQTLEEGLAKIFGTTSVEETRKESVETSKTSAVTFNKEDLPAGRQDLIRQANEVFEKATRAQRDGDWSMYGQEIRRLGEILKKLQ